MEGGERGRGSEEALSVEVRADAVNYRDGEVIAVIVESALASLRLLREESRFLNQVLFASSLPWWSECASMVRQAGGLQRIG